MKPMTESVEHPAHEPTTVKEWLEHMKHKAAYNIAKACGCKQMPDSEEDIKKMVAHAKKHGSCTERAEVEYEAGEWLYFSMTLMMMEKFPSVVPS